MDYVIEFSIFCIIIGAIFCAIIGVIFIAGDEKR